jgi:hypothetical protein
MFLGPCRRSVDVRWRRAHRLIAEYGWLRHTLQPGGVPAVQLGSRGGARKRRADDATRVTLVVLARLYGRLVFGAQPFVVIVRTAQPAIDVGQESDEDQCVIRQRDSTSPGPLFGNGDDIPSAALGAQDGDRAEVWTDVNSF